MPMNDVSLPNNAEPTTNAEATTNIELTTEGLQELFHYWFVKYNPLYFFSALCILGGVFLVSRELEQLQWATGKLILATVVQVYEFSLIFGAALLFRKLGQQRPAVILLLLEILFLFDCTCETEVLMSLGKTGLLLASVCAGLIVVKIGLLAWAFQLKLAKEFFIIPALAAIGLVAAPKIITSGVFDKKSAHVLITWALCGLVALVIRQWPEVRCNFKLDLWASTVLRRSINATWGIWLGICLMHLLSWMAVYNIGLSTAHYVPFIMLLLFTAKQEEWIWVTTFAAVFVSLDNMAMFAPTVFIIALILFWKGWEKQVYRFWIGSILAVYFGLYLENLHYWAVPKFGLVLNLSAGIVLLLISWRLRMLPAALIGAFLVLLPMAYYGKTMTMLNLGVLLLGSGFLSLIAGIMFNWKQSSLIKPES